MNRMRRGSVTIESAIVIPICLLILAGLVSFGVTYANDIKDRASSELDIDKVHVMNENPSFFTDPKTLVRVTDAVSDFVDQFTYTREIKENINETVESLKDKFKD